MISCPRPKSLARSGLIATNFHLSFRKLFDNCSFYYLLLSSCHCSLGYSNSVDSYSKISLTSLHNSLLVFHKVCCRYHPCQPNLDSARCYQPSLYCGALSTDTIMCDRVSTNSYTRELSLQGSVSLQSLTPFGRYP